MATPAEIERQISAITPGVEWRLSWPILWRFRSPFRLSRKNDGAISSRRHWFLPLSAQSSILSSHLQRFHFLVSAGVSGTTNHRVIPRL